MDSPTTEHHSPDFITSSDFPSAWEALKEATGTSRLSGVRLERSVGKGGWRTSATGSKADLREVVRALDHAPVPGRFRLTVG